MHTKAKIVGSNQTLGDYHHEEDFSFIMEFSDETAEDRTEAEMDAFADELSEVAGKYGFDKSCWGPKESMTDMLIRGREHERKLLRDVFRERDRDEV